MRNPTPRIHTHWQVAQSSRTSLNLPKSMAAPTLTEMKIKKHGHTIEWQPTTLNFRPTHWAKDSELSESPHITKRTDHVLGGSQNSLTFLGFGSIAIFDMQVIFQERSIAPLSKAFLCNRCAHNRATSNCPATFL